jgi:hypothetical protein
MIKLMKLLSKVNFNWKTNPDAKGDKKIYHGQIFTAGEDYFFTVKGKKLWKFEYGVNDTKHYPYVKFVKKVRNIKFPSGDNNIEYDGKMYWPLGDAVLYKLKNGKILWEF